MNILVINCGSSSLKFQLINAQSEELIAKGCPAFPHFNTIKSCGNQKDNYHNHAGKHHYFLQNAFLLPCNHILWYNRY